MFIILVALILGIGVWSGSPLFSKTVDVIGGLSALFVGSMIILTYALHLWRWISPPCWVSLWDVRSGEELRRLRGPRGDDRIESLSFSPCGKFLAGGGTDRRAYSWGVPSGALVRKFCGPGAAPLSEKTPVWNIIFAPHGRALIGGYGEEPIQYWDVETGKQIKEVRSEVGYVEYLMASPDRSLVVLGSSHEDGFSSVLLKADAGSVQARLDVETYGALCSLAISPDNERLACLVGSCEVQMWEISTERLLWKAGADGATMNALALSPDGKTIASSSDKHGVQLRDAATGEPIHNVSCDCAMYRLAFSPDGKTLAACGSDGRVRMLDTATWKETLELGCADTEGPIAFSPNGRFLAALNE